MAKPRNYWILRGVRGANARQRLLDYYAGTLTRESKLGTRGPRPASKTLYLDPFSLPLATDHVLRESCLLPTWTTLSAIAPTQNHVTDAIGASTAVRVKSYKAPRITRITLDTTGTVTTADVTGLQYMKYDNTSMSIPFGRNLIGDTVASVAADLIAAYTAQAGFAARLIPERV